jgi:hypothetical protein
MLVWVSELIHDRSEDWNNHNSSKAENGLQGERRAFQLLLAGTGERFRDP